MRYLLDTDHLSILQIGQGREFGQIMSHIDRLDGDDYGFSIVSFHEQTIGCHTYLNRAKNEASLLKGYRKLAKIIGAFSDSEVVLFESAAITQYLNLRNAGSRVGAMDLRIAATALANNLILVTRNTVDFSKIPGLALEDWTI